MNVQLMPNHRKRVAVFLSAPVSDEQKEKIRTGRAPRHDLLTLAERLGATLILSTSTDAYRNSRSGLRVWHLARMGWQAFKRRNDYDVIVTDLDAVGGVLAILFKITRSKKGHVVICHGKLSSGWQARFTRWFRLKNQIDYFVCYGAAVASKFIDKVNIPPEQVKLVRHPADHHWWVPTSGKPERLVSSAGMTRRDYSTLAEAVRDLDVKIQIAAHSPWVDGRAETPSAPAPNNVTFTRLPQSELRDLYARSLFVVVPLLESTGQAGSLVIYEAMAMGKAVIVAHTTGEKALGLIEEGKTGLFYEPGDVKGLRKAIQRLLEDPDEAKRLGDGARARVERDLNMDRYFDEMVGLVESLTGETYPDLSGIGDADSYSTG